MATSDSSTPRNTRAIVAAQHTVTINPDGSATCSCPSYRNSRALFGEGWCPHLRQADELTRPADSNPADLADFIAKVKQLDTPDVWFLLHVADDLLSGRMVPTGAGSVKIIGD